MCLIDCAAIDYSVTIPQFPAVYMVGTFTDTYYFTTINPNGANDEIPNYDFQGKKHQAEGDLVVKCLFLQRNNTPAQYTQKLRIALDKLHDRGVTVIFKPGTPPGGEEATTTAQYNPNGDVTQNQTATILYDKIKIKEAAAAYGVTYGEEFVYVMAHELGHLGLLKQDQHDPGPLTDPYWSTTQGIWDRAVYPEATGDGAPPRYKWVLNQHAVVPGNAVPTCVQNVMNQYGAYFHSIDSGRAAMYQYPTYTPSYELSTFHL